MEQTLKDYLQQSWLHKLQKAQICISDDADGLLSGSLLKHEKGWKINMFFDKKKRAKLDLDNDLPIVFVDCANHEGYSIDNHVIMYSKDSKINETMINLNLFNRISARGDNYNNKYAMSTLLMCYIALGRPLPTSELGKLILIAIDVGYKGYYSERFKASYIKNLEQLGLTDLIPVLEKYTFEQIQQFHVDKLKAGFDKINLEFCGWDLFMLEQMDSVYDMISKELGFPIELPKGNFTVIEEYETLTGATEEKGDLMEREDIFSSVYIYQGKVSYSKRKPKRKKKAGA